MPYNQHSAIVGALRRCWSRHPKKTRVILKNAHKTLKGPRGGILIICQKCKQLFSRSSVAVDHIDPVIPLGVKSKDMSYDDIISRMFDCPDENLQVLCLNCHKKKTSKERKLRRNKSS